MGSFPIIAHRSKRLLVFAWLLAAVTGGGASALLTAAHGQVLGDVIFFGSGDAAINVAPVQPAVNPRSLSADVFLANQDAAFVPNLVQPVTLPQLLTASVFMGNADARVVANFQLPASFANQPPPSKDNYADMGNPDDEAFHNIQGWGEAQSPPEKPLRIAKWRHNEAVPDVAGQQFSGPCCSRNRDSACFDGGSGGRRLHG